MAKKIYKCNFNYVNGDNTGVFTRTAMTKNSPSPGILYRKNCPEGPYFYADPDVGGTNNYYKLIDPQKYKINASGTVYVWLNKSFLTSWELVDDPSEVKTPEPEPIVSTYVAPTVNAKNLEKNSDYISFGSASSGGVIYSTSGELLNDDITNYVSYTTVDRVKSNVKKDKYFNDYSFVINDINKIENNLNIGLNADAVSAVKNNLLNKFNRFLIAFPETSLPKTFAHVFFTRPDLNLYNESTGALLDKISNDSFYYFLNKNSPDLLKSLTMSFSSTHDFNPYLSNVAASFGNKDEYIDTGEYGATYTGWKIKYGKHNINSKNAGEFDITYTDDSNLNVYKIHKAWVEYISRVYRGEFDVKRSSITSHTLDYACSVYYFLCGPDGETILFWSKYTGVFPTNIPSNAFAWTKGNIVKMPEYAIQYEYSWKEDMSPTSLAEFNLNSSRQSRYLHANIYEPNNLGTGKTFVDAPFITTTFDKVGGYEYKLRFRAPN